MTAQPSQPAAPGESPAPGKPTVEELGIDVRTLDWQRSGRGAGSIEIALVGFGGTAAATGSEWVLMRVADDPAQRVLVYDRHEWECFLDGVKNGEFDDATQ
ncbi:MAG: DUF397 domain-containing protein [Kitasatospora sp.]|jgi:hypothetical protein|nr:DUF397 domain-containing protein [Kitasatospora sp.]